jgi:phospholipid-translocating ATPase
MLLWIIVYSFFRSSDFVDEVVVLFGNVAFWTAVVFSVFVALGEYFCYLSFVRSHS